MMDRLYTNLGLTTVISGLGLTPAPDAGAAYLQRSLQQIEAAMPTFNLDPAMAHLAAEIAAFEDDLPAAQRVALIMLIASSIVALNEGSTRLPVTGPHARDPMARILGVLCADPDAHENTPRVTEIFTSIATMLDAGGAPSVIARTPDEFRPLLYLPPYIYHQRVRAAEVRLADNLRPHLARTTAFASDSEIVAALIDLNDRPQWLGANKMMLSDTQRDAVRNIATRRLSLVSGGPGTGKTSIVLALVRLLVRLGIEPGAIALAAPTGKAAHRMGESLRGGLDRIRDPAAADLELITARLEPVTVHRLLGYSPRREMFFHHRNNPLPATVAIIDESSMLDLDLMQRLAAALPPEARVVLLGDADQLPSVAAGAVFRDLVAAIYDNREIDGAICTRLTRSYRMNPDEAAGSAIFNFARSVNQGAIVDEDGPPLIQERADPVAVRFEGVELVGAHGPAIGSFLDHWFGARIRDPEIDALAAKTYSGGENGFDDQALAELRRIYSHLAAARILCVTRVLVTGADRINEAMHRCAVASSRRSADRWRFLAGEPVMVVRNDYARNLFNGDQGIIVRVKRPDGAESPMAVFVRADRVDAFHLATLGDVLELCYATTIHKSQGSEFDCVAVILPDRDLPLLTRELLYTAATRARKSVVLVGSNEMVRTASARKATRYSGLAELLNPAIANVQQ
jgi:exodeoxyribonuclease V alpha subunit